MKPLQMPKGFVQQMSSRLPDDPENRFTRYAAATIETSREPEAYLAAANGVGLALDVFDQFPNPADAKLALVATLVRLNELAGGGERKLLGPSDLRFTDPNAWRALTDR
jgi:hypothetical protein